MNSNYSKVVASSSCQKINKLTGETFPTTTESTVLGSIFPDAKAAFIATVVNSVMEVFVNLPP